jgi:hypothetical protein
MATAFSADLHRGEIVARAAPAPAAPQRARVAVVGHLAQAQAARGGQAISATEKNALAAISRTMTAGSG